MRQLQGEAIIGEVDLDNAALETLPPDGVPELLWELGE